MADLGPRDPTRGSRRAPRYPIQTTLQYRLSGETTWSDGRTENISRSGLLFRAGNLLEVNAPIEMSFVLPVEMAGEAAVKVSCRGRIVRAIPPVVMRPWLGLAATISDYRFVRGKGGPGQ